MAANVIRFIGTGRPVNPSTNPQLNREASRNGIEFSGVKTNGEFQQKILKKLNVPATVLGRNAVTITRFSSGGIDLFT